MVVWFHRNFCVGFGLRGTEELAIAIKRPDLLLSWLPNWQLLKIRREWQNATWAHCGRIAWVVHDFLAWVVGYLEIREFSWFSGRIVICRWVADSLDWYIRVAFLAQRMGGSVVMVDAGCIGSWIDHLPNLLLGEIWK